MLYFGKLGEWVSATSFNNTISHNLLISKPSSSLPLNMFWNFTNTTMQLSCVIL